MPMPMTASTHVETLRGLGVAKLLHSLSASALQLAAHFLLNEDSCVGVPEKADLAVIAAGIQLV